MGRYSNTLVKKNKIGQRVYGVTLYPTIPIQDGDQSLWWIIAEANQLKDGGFALEPDIELRIPRNIAPILQEFRNINEEFLNR